MMMHANQGIRLRRFMIFAAVVCAVLTPLAITVAQQRVQPQRAPSQRVQPTRQGWQTGPTNPNWKRYQSHRGGRNSLDANLQAGSGGRNTAVAQGVPISRSPYRVNRNSGDMQYDMNRAFGSRNAFAVSSPYGSADRYRLRIRQ